MSTLRTVLVGADTLLVECGEVLRRGGHDIAAVVAGSARVRQWALGHGLTVLDGEGPVAAWRDGLAAVEHDWLFSITHLALLPDDVLALPRRGAINFHDGPLPAYAGLNTPAWALLRGETTYGITWHAITSGVDEGDVYVQRTFDLAPDETSLSLNMRNFEAGLETFEALVAALAAGTATTTPQDPAAPRATFRRADRPEALGLLDWRRPAAELARVVRALDFGPYPNTVGTAKVEAGGVVLHVTDAAEADGTGDPGTVLAADADQLVVAAGEGALALRAFTTPTGRPVTPPEAAALLTRLDVRGDGERAELSAAGRRLALAEPGHLAALRGAVAVELPWAGTPSADHVAAYADLPLDVPAAAPAAVAAALGALLGRISGTPAFHVGLALATAGPVAPFVLPAVPLPVEVGPDDDAAALTATLRDALAATTERGPIAAEVVARHPDLAGRPELAAGGLLPVVLRIDAPGEPAPGTVVEVVGTGDRWSVRYDTGLVDADDAGLLVTCLEAVAADMAANPARRVADLDLLGPELRATVLDRWNDTAAPVPADACIHDLIEATVDRTPAATAVVFEDATLDYAELERRANRLAHHLRALGTGPDSLVGVHVERGLHLPVAVLAVHKAGGAYVPLDPTYPRDRLEHMIRDSGCRVVLTDTEAGAVPVPDGATVEVVDLDADAAAIAAHPDDRVPSPARPADLAYCIYTSGSTGLPKGVLVEHRNAVNFFVGMDAVVAPDPVGTWFAVTSLSFDISVLELLYTLTRGFTVVVHRDRERTTGPAPRTRPMDFSLFYFSGDAATEGADKYRLLLEGARWADEHGFTAVWTPERHFHAFGGLYPEPAVTGAAVAAITKHVQVRAGSVVLPLHHPVRVAEAWSIVDNISGGRVGISVAAGWQPNDFVLRPEAYATAKQTMFDELAVVQKLWRGEAVSFPGPTGAPVEVRTLPRPVQPELPVWVTTAGTLETYVLAGRAGANVLTHLLGQSVEQLAPKIEAYRKARAEAGHDPDGGVVTLMLHTFLGDDLDAVRATVREPLKQYLRTSFSLLREYAWAFPAFQRPEGDQGGLTDDHFANLSEEELDAVLDFAFLRYFETSGLFGTPEACEAMVDRLGAIGVGEVAALLDFGVDDDAVLASLPLLDDLRRRCSVVADAPAEPAADQSVAAQLARHRVTHLQCTPSMARMLTMQDDARAALAGVEHLFIGGEAFPVALAKDLHALAGPGAVTNMYGPTETTIWSTTWPLAGDLDVIPIGTPIANTDIYVLDRNLRPQPPGVAGELWIGGLGVVRGYHERPELTAERFVPDPFRGGGARMYRTGDLARWRRQADGSGIVEFLGRLDHQVKIRGYRIELGEIEACLGRQPGVLECVAVVHTDAGGDQQLAAYLSPTEGATVDPAAVKVELRRHLPEVMVPAHVVVLPSLPHTPNGKIDRNGLPSLAGARGPGRPDGVAAAPAGTDVERQLVELWEDALGVSGVGVDDNFFDIGGHSLLVVRVHRRVRELIDDTVALTDLYRYPTIRAFAAALGSGGSTEALEASAARGARRREALRRRRG